MAGLYVAVQAVVGHVELAVGEPLEEGWVGVVQEDGWLPEPGHPVAGLRFPIRDRVGGGLLMDAGLGVGLFGERRRRPEDAVFLQ